MPLINHGPPEDQKKTGQPVRFEVTEHTREAVDDYIRATGKKSGEFLFGGRRSLGQCISSSTSAGLCKIDHNDEAVPDAYQSASRSRVRRPNSATNRLFCCSSRLS